MIQYIIQTRAVIQDSYLW